MINFDLIGDWSLAVLSAAATVATFVRIQFLDRSMFCRRLAFSCVALGWTVLTARLWLALLAGDNPTVHPLSQVALTLIAFGSCWVTADVIHKHFNRVCLWGVGDK